MGTDVFSAAHPDAAWVPFQLGYELMVAGLDRLAGEHGLALLKLVHAALFATGGLLLAQWLVRRKHGGRLPPAWVVVAVVAFWVLIDERLRLRPHAVNLVIETAFLLPVAAGA